jgi:hypothetical protein
MARSATTKIFLFMSTQIKLREPKSKDKTNGSVNLIAEMTAEEYRACIQAAQFEEMKISDWVRNAILRAAGLCSEED